MSVRTWTGFFVGALVAGGTLSACSMFEKSSGSQAQIIFSHATHQKAEVDCSTCHETVYEAENLSARHMPKEKVCLGCHKAEKDKSNCGFCHGNPDKPRTYPAKTTELVFNHASHLERVKDEDCGVCHKQLHEPKDRLHHAPEMAVCLDCHQHQKQYDEARCDVCHTDLWRYGLVPVSDFSHKGDFLRRHSAEARASGQSCAMCHEQAFCTDCHAMTTALRPELANPERVDREFIHRIGFEERHHIEASADPALCMRCHGQSYCEDCHTRNNLTPQGTNPRNPHPPNYALPGPNSHAVDARVNIAQCATCHDQGRNSNCVSCHKVGGMGGNPHPPGYSDQHPREEIDTNNMCRACHD